MFTPFRPLDHVHVTHANLPHWSQRGATYFVTFRLKDSLPQGKLQSLQLEKEAWLRAHPRPWTAVTEAEYHQHFSNAFHAWLDAGAGSCLFNADRSRHIVIESLRYFATRRYHLDEFVVAANHVHAVVEPLGTWSLPRIVETWKSFTARSMGKGSIWQKESYDHIVRDLADLMRIRRYIRTHREWTVSSPSRDSLSTSH